MNAMGINQLIMDPARALKSLPESTACCVSPAAGPRPRMSRLVSSRPAPNSHFNKHMSGLGPAQTRPAPLAWTGISLTTQQLARSLSAWSSRIFRNPD